MVVFIVVLERRGGMTNGDMIRKCSNEELVKLFLNWDFYKMIDSCSGGYHDDETFLTDWVNREVDK